MSGETDDDVNDDNHDWGKEFMHGRGCSCFERPLLAEIVALKAKVEELLAEQEEYDQKKPDIRLSEENATLKADIIAKHDAYTALNDENAALRAKLEKLRWLLGLIWENEEADVRERVEAALKGEKNWLDEATSLRARLAIAQEIIGEEWPCRCEAPGISIRPNHFEGCLRARWFEKEEK